MDAIPEATRRRRAAARAARRHLGIPRIPARIAEQVLSRAPVTELRRVGLSDDNAARGLDSRHHHVIHGGDVILEDEGAARGAHPGGAAKVLDGHRDAVERAHVLAAKRLLLSLLGCCHRLVAAHGEEGIELGVELLDALEHVGSQLHWRKLSPRNPLSKLPGRGEGQVGVGQGTTSGGLG